MSENERDNFNSIVNDMINSSIKITHNAVRLTLKLFKDTNIKVFPCVLKSACKGNSISDGSYAFTMWLLSDKIKYISSPRRIKDLLLKNNMIISYTSMSIGGDQLIDI